MRHETRTICAECGKEFDTYEPVIVCPECVASPENELDYQRRMALAYQAEARDLRAALAERDAKIRELDGDLASLAATWRQVESRLTAINGKATEPETRGNAHGHASRCETTRRRLRELGLITEEPK